MRNPLQNYTSIFKPIFFFRPNIIPNRSLYQLEYLTTVSTKILKAHVAWEKVLANAYSCKPTDLVSHIKT
jgi:hypothetical protein